MNSTCAWAIFCEVDLELMFGSRSHNPHNTPSETHIEVEYSLDRAPSEPFNVES